MFPLSRRRFRLEGNRVVVHAPRGRDFPEWAELRRKSAAQLRAWEPTWAEDANTLADWRRRQAGWRIAWQRGTGYGLLIRLKEGGALAGGISLGHVRRGPAQMATLGYWLADSFQGSGYMTEAVSLICDWAFHGLGLARIEAGVVPENTRSLAVLRRCGFEEEGYARSYLQIAGERRDHILFALMRDQATGETR